MQKLENEKLMLINGGGISITSPDDLEVFNPNAWYEKVKTIVFETKDLIDNKISDFASSFWSSFTSTLSKIW
jgi:hypothetical protein